MTTGVTSTTSITSYFNSIQEGALFVARESMIMPNLVTRYNATTWANRLIPVFPEISAQAVTETEDFANPTVFGKSAGATLTPSEVMAQVILTDREIATDPEDSRANASRELGMAIASKMEQDLLDLFASFTDSHGAGANATFTLASIGTSVASLRTAKTPGPYYGVLHPLHWLDVWNEIGKPTTNVVASDAANAALRDYFVANLVGVLFYQHAMISVDGSGDATSAIFNREALALDLRKPPTLEYERDASKRAWELNESAGYAAGIRRNAYGCKLIADAS